MHYGQPKWHCFTAESLDNMARNEASISHLDRLIAYDDANGSNQSDKEIFKIGDLAKEFDVTLRTLRFYEDRGLITPKRSGSTRLYSRTDRARMKLILLAKRIGFSLIEIHELMEIYDLDESNEWHLKLIIDKFKAQVTVLSEQKIELEKSIIELDETIGSLEEMI